MARPQKNDGRPPTPAANRGRIVALEAESARLEFQLERLTEMVNRHQRDLDVQLQRIAQIQADLDEVRSAWVKARAPRKGT